MNIKNELRSIDIQTNIRRLISRPMDVSNNLQPLENRMHDQLNGEKHREEIFEYSKKIPMDIKGMAASLYQLAIINRDYYSINATQYADVAQGTPTTDNACVTSRMTAHCSCVPPVR